MNAPHSVSYSERYAWLSVRLLAISPILTFLFSWDETTGWKPMKSIAQSSLPAGFQVELPMESTGWGCKLGEGCKRERELFALTLASEPD